MRFVNRQRGSGTRVWLDQQLQTQGVVADDIVGYEREALTHSEVAGLVAEGEADAGLALEGSAAAFGLGFIPLTLEIYDLVAVDSEAAGVSDLVRWLGTSAARQVVATLGGYETDVMGRVRWVG